MSYRDELRAALIALSEEASSNTSQDRGASPAELDNVIAKVDSLAIVLQPGGLVEPDATQKIFGVPELLEAILLNLNLTLRDVLILRDVCKDWKDTIESSRALQVKSYSFKPADTAEATAQVTATAWVEGSMAVQDKPYSFKPADTAKATALSTAGAWVDKRLLHTLIDKIGYAHYARHATVDFDWKRPEAFWRKLLLCSPVATTVSLRIGYFKNPHYHEKTVRCADRSGVTLEHLWDSICKTMKAGARHPGRGRCELDSVEVISLTRGTFKWAPGATDGVYSFTGK